MARAFFIHTDYHAQSMRYLVSFYLFFFALSKRL